MEKVLVITPTIGADELLEACVSVAKQTYPETYHLVVVDGADYEDKTNLVLDKIKDITEGYNFFKCVLPFNTGQRGYYGHRIYSGFSHLTDFEYIIFLDQDNWFEPNHVEEMVRTIQRNNYDWCYGLRKLYSKDGQYICDDNCESLGEWPCLALEKELHHIDTNCYCFTNKFIRGCGSLWDYGYAADQMFYRTVVGRLGSKNFGCSGKYTINYRLDCNKESSRSSVYMIGNEKMKEKYGGTYPWNKD